jgi:hypothetical protein
MTWITRHALAISVAILPSFFAVTSSVAQSCQFNGNCKLPLTCQPGLFGGYCAVQACNADTDCRNGSSCFLGTCLAVCARNSDCDRGEICVRGETSRVCVQRPAVGAGGGGTTGYYIERGMCGTVRAGRIVKHIGCARGLRCVLHPDGTGTCQRPQT